MRVTKHFLEDGKKVWIKEMGEVVTVNHKWYASNTGWEIHVEHPATWYFKHK